MQKTKQKETNYFYQSTNSYVDSPVFAPVPSLSYHLPLPTSNFFCEAVLSRISAFWFDLWIFCIMRRIIPKSGKGRRSRIGRLSFTSSDGISRLIPIHLTEKGEANAEEEKDFFDVEENRNRNSWNNQNKNRSQIPSHTTDCDVYVIFLFYPGVYRVNEIVFCILL